MRRVFSVSALGADSLCWTVGMGEKQAPRLCQYGDLQEVELPESTP